MFCSSLKLAVMGDVCGNWSNELNRPVQVWYQGSARMATFEGLNDDIDWTLYADAGFRYVVDNLKGNIIRCCFCPVELDPVELTPDDKPHKLHRYLYSSCPFVQCKVTENDPVHENPFIDMKFKLSRYLPHWI